MRPLVDSIERRNRLSCRASASRIASGNCSHSVVLPAMSVNRKVTVPAGSLGGAGTFEDIADGAALTRSKTHSASGLPFAQPGVTSAAPRKSFGRGANGGLWADLRHRPAIGLAVRAKLR